MEQNPLADKIVKLLQNAGVAITSSQLVAMAAQYRSVPPNLLILSGIWAADQVLTFLPGPTSGLVYSDDYGGVAPTFTPPSAGAIAIDSLTRRQWQWSNNVWT